MRPWVDAQVAAGRFADEAEAIQAALVALAERDAKISNLNALIQEGLDAVDAGQVTEYASPEDATAAIINTAKSL